MARDEKRVGTTHRFAIGDLVLLKRVPAAVAAESGTSRRLLARADPNVYVIHRVLSPQTVILADPDTGETDFSFGQPVSTSRLIPFDRGDLEEPFEAGALHLEILRGDERWSKAEVRQQSATGAVRLKFADGREEVVDLSREEYRWLQ